MGPKRSLPGGDSRGRRDLMKRRSTSRVGGPRQRSTGAKRPRQTAAPALAWGDDADGEQNAGLESDSEDEERERGEAVSKERKEIAEAKEAAEAEAKETAEEKRLRLARDVLLRLDAEQQEKDEDDEDETQEEDGEAASGDYIGERLARARLEATGQLYREVARGLEGKKIHFSAVRRMRGHKLTPTCVALSSDDSTVYSGSKDNSVVRWDVETGKRVVMLPSWRKLPGGKVPKVKAHSNEVLSVAVSDDGRYLATSGRNKVIKVWDCRTDKVVETFKGHQDSVSCLTFRSNSLHLFSGSHDRCVKHWDLNEMGYVETMFGHQSEINAIDAWRKERAVTGGRDRTVRLWKVVEDSHLVFRPVGGGSIDCLTMLNEDWFVTGGEDGSLALWFAMKKKPAVLVPAAHGYSSAGTPRWISAVSCLKQSDLVVSGSNDGSVRLWRADVEARSMEQVASVPVEGFVNGLAVSSTGKFLVAAVGQEHRLGRWEHFKEARNEICVVQLPTSDDTNENAVVDMDTEDAGSARGGSEQTDIDGTELDE